MLIIDTDGSKCRKECYKRWSRGWHRTGDGLRQEKGIGSTRFVGISASLRSFSAEESIAHSFLVVYKKKNVVTIPKGFHEGEGVRRG